MRSALALRSPVPAGAGALIAAGTDADEIPQINLRQ